MPTNKKAAKKSPKTKAQAKGKPAAARKPGVIDGLIELLRNGGGTIDQLFAKLSKKFPARGEAMKTTIRIQVSRLKNDPHKLPVKSEKTDKGTVYSLPASAKDHAKAA